MWGQKENIIIRRILWIKAESILEVREEVTRIRTVKYMIEQQEDHQHTFRDTQLEDTGRTDALTVKCQYNV